MFIPLRTDHPPRRTPIATQSLIMANLLVYAIGLAAEFGGLFELRTLMAWGMYDPQDFNAWQLVTYQFMHSPHSLFHLAFNMLFLWVFGGPIEDRLGRWGFVGFYIIGGIVAALAHTIVSPQAGVIGASGSVCAVTGAFLALLPRSRILVLFFIMPIVLPALWVIGLFFMIDLLRQVQDLFGGGVSNVAYAAHLAGYIYGFGVGFALLALGLVRQAEVDVFHLWKQARRRAAFRAAARASHGGVWDAHNKKSGEMLKQRAAAKPPTELDEQTQANAELRAEIGRLVDAHDVPAAGAKYRELLDRDKHTVLPEHRQLDIANQLFAEDDVEHAARAYELFLNNYARSMRANEVRLMLGLLYVRRLNQPDRARPLLERARENSRDDGHRQLAAQLLGELAT